MIVLSIASLPTHEVSASFSHLTRMDQNLKTSWANRLCAPTPPGDDKPSHIPIGMESTQLDF